MLDFALFSEIFFNEFELFFEPFRISAKNSLTRGRHRENRAGEEVLFPHFTITFSQSFMPFDTISKRRRSAWWLRSAAAKAVRSSAAPATASPAGE